VDVVLEYSNDPVVFVAVGTVRLGGIGMPSVSLLCVTDS
jgi:hypothetical protein